MDYKIKYLPLAEADIDGIGAYLSQFYESTFRNFLQSLEKGIGNLKTAPYLGAPYRDYRRLVISDYLVFYKVDETRHTVEIYRVLHGARDSQVRAFPRPL